MPTKTEWWGWLEEQMFRRGGLDFTQTKLAEAIDLRQSTISEWKNKGSLPEDKIVIRIAFLFNADVAEVFNLLGRGVPDKRTIIMEQTWMMLRQLNGEYRDRVFKEIQEQYHAQKAQDETHDDDN